MLKQVAFASPTVVHIAEANAGVGHAAFLAETLERTQTRQHD